MTTLSEQRQAAGLTQEQVASQMGCDRAWVSRLERSEAPTEDARDRFLDAVRALESARHGDPLTQATREAVRLQVGARASTQARALMLGAIHRAKREGSAVVDAGLVEDGLRRIRAGVKREVTQILDGMLAKIFRPIDSKPQRPQYFIDWWGLWCLAHPLNLGELYYLRQAAENFARQLQQQADIRGIHAECRPCGGPQEPTCESVPVLDDLAAELCESNGFWPRTRWGDPRPVEVFPQVPAKVLRDRPYGRPWQIGPPPPPGTPRPWSHPSDRDLDVYSNRFDKENINFSTDEPPYPVLEKNS